MFSVEEKVSEAVPELCQQLFILILSALQAHGLVGGRHLGVDSSVMEPNVSLRRLVNRNTEGD